MTTDVVLEVINSCMETQL